MHPHVNNEYLAQRVLTASPQQLRLMLIEAALRHLQRAQQSHASKHWDSYSSSLSSAEDIVLELLASLQLHEADDLLRRVAGCYLFVQRRLSAAHAHRESTSLNDAIRVLEIERETWRQVCAAHVSGGFGAHSGSLSLDA